MAQLLQLERTKTQNNPVVQQGQVATYEENWQAFTDVEISQLQVRSMINALTASNQFGWPIMGVTPHPDSSVMFPTVFSVKRDEGLTLKHHIVLSYTDEEDAINSSQLARNARPVYDYQDVDVREEARYDPINEKLIVTSNNEPPYPYPIKNTALTRIIVSRNETSFDANRIKKFKKHQNQGSVRIDRTLYPNREILCENITGTSAIDSDGVQYYKVKYKFLHDPDEHIFKWIDSGRGKSLSGKKPPEFNNTTKALKLDGQGEYMNASDQADPKKIVFNENYLYPEVSMASLNL